MERKTNRVRHSGSVTKLVDFLKFFVSNFLTKEAQMYVDFLGSFEYITFMFNMNG